MCNHNTQWPGPGSTGLGMHLLLERPNERAVAGEGTEG